MLNGLEVRHDLTDDNLGGLNLSRSHLDLPKREIIQTVKQLTRANPLLRLVVMKGLFGSGGHGII